MAAIVCGGFCSDKVRYDYCTINANIRAVHGAVEAESGWKEVRSQRLGEKDPRPSLSRSCADHV